MQSGQLNVSICKRALLALVVVRGELVVSVMMCREPTESAAEKLDSVAAVTDAEPTALAVELAAPADPHIAAFGIDR